MFFVEWLLDLGYIGLFVGAFLAATVIPFSSDALLVGMLAAGAAPVHCIIIATAGNWLGSLTSYWMGYMGKWEWIEKYLRVKRQTLEKQQSRIAAYGSSIALFTWLPAVGDVLAVTLGFYKVDFKKTSVFMLTGICLRYVAWAIFFFWVKTLF